MRQRSWNHFWGSLVSTQFLIAYSISSGILTLIHLVGFWTGNLTSMPRRIEALPRFIDLYIEIIIPVWIPPFTGYNFLILMVNISLAVLILLMWSVRYDNATGY